jgi:hypothetical protein
MYWYALCTNVRIFLNGMVFDDVKADKKFYKEYAHAVGFSIRIGQQRVDDSGVVK